MTRREGAGKSALAQKKPPEDSDVRVDIPPARGPPGMAPDGTPSAGGRNAALYILLFMVYFGRVGCCCRRRCCC